MFTKHAGGVSVIIASRYQATELYTVAATPGKEVVATSVRIKPVQLGLFQ